MELHKLILVFLILTSSISIGASKYCRCVASDDLCWPAEQAWNSFNSSLSGGLIVVRPPAWPCHDPYYDQSACEVVTSNWTVPTWRSAQPGAMMEFNWELDHDPDRGVLRGCLIHANRNSTCYQGSVPLYAINVTEVSQVQRAVRFASEHNIRLVVRNTGHDYLGRSTAKGSLSIWLHHLNDISFHDNFVPANCNVDLSPGEPAVTFGAGVQWEQLYRAVWERSRRVIVGGECPTVGAAGGYPQGGGHSPISPAFGLAADNILQYQVVTADGKLRTANRCENEDLFWALRGGGGGTFGIVVSATQRTHPPFSNLIYAGFNLTADSRSTFERILSKFMELNPSLSEAGWSGYFFASAMNTLQLVYMLPNRDISFANASLRPLWTYVSQDADIQVKGGLQSFKSFEGWRRRVSLSFPIGVPMAAASRLIPKQVVETSSPELSRALVHISESSKDIIIMGALVAGGRVSEEQDSAVNPAWRKALFHMVVYTTWEDAGSRTQKSDAMRLLTSSNKFLIDLTPDSGSYLNEADYGEPEFQSSFFGEHYNRLYRIKQQVDPEGLFVCHHCVGSEDWSEGLNCRLKTVS